MLPPSDGFPSGVSSARFKKDIKPIDKASGMTFALKRTANSGRTQLIGS